MAKYRKLGRTSDQRKALLKNQVTALLYTGRVVTTEAKAKEVQKIAEGLIALKEAAPDANVLQLKSLEAFAKAADGQATKIIIPSDIQGLAGSISAIAETVKK